MKTKLTTAFLICFFANLFIAQTLVKPADIKMPSIATFLKSKGYDIVEQTDTFVKLTNSHKSLLYMDLDTDKKYILFNVNISIVTGTSRAKIDSLINQINNIGIEYFYGSTVSAFKNFIEAFDVDCIAYPKDYNFKALNKYSIDPKFLTERSGCEVIYLNIMTIHVQESLIESRIPESQLKESNA